MKQVSELYKIITLSFLLLLFYHSESLAREKIVMMTTGEDFTEEAHRFNLSQAKYELVVEKDKFINWRRAANRFRFLHNLSAAEKVEKQLDLAFVDNNWLPGLIHNGWLAELPGLETERKRFVPCLIDAATKGGKLYALPFNTKGLVLFYRSDLHTRYGLKKPRSLDELASNCRVLMKKEPLDHGLTIHYSAIHLDVLPFIWSQGGDILKNGKAALESPETIETLNALGELSREGILPNKNTFSTLKKSYRAALTLFKEGRSAYLITWNDRVSDLENSDLKGRFGVLPVPSFKREQKHYSVIGSWYFAVLDTSMHKDGARAFLDFMFSDAVQKTMADQRPGFLPSLDIKGHPGQRDVRDALSTMRLRLNHPMEQEISHVFENAVRQIVVEGQRAEEILPAADFRIDALLKRK